MGEIYIVTNTITGKRYVGQTKYATDDRWKQHIEDSELNRSNSYLHRSIRKYGVTAFVVKRVLKNVPLDILDDLEIKCIQRYNTLAPNGYNLCRGGGGVKGYRHTEETKNMAWRKAISESRLGKFKGADNPFGGKHHTQETKARISEANSKAVLMCSLDGEVVKRFNSLVEARDYLIGEGITSNKSCQTPISKCCRGVEQRKSCYGFVWKYEKV